jgi:hypothetical protein
VLGATKSPLKMLNVPFNINLIFTIYVIQQAFGEWKFRVSDAWKRAGKVVS